MKYRLDIQILRGVSILLVVLFHMSVNGFERGFLGVDVFFVISGFLMAVLYKGDGVGAFFLKRGQRLLPAYYVTLLGTLLVGMLVLFPTEQAQVVRQSIYSLLFIPNVGFWLQNSYFNKTDFNPLLHFWSLGVELQYYLLMPLIFWFGRKWKWSTALLFFGSLAACLLLVAVSPNAAFFLMPFRIWEFLVGYFVARKFTNEGNLTETGRRPWLGGLSLVILLLLPLFPVDGTVRSVVFGHPGLIAVLACLATAGVLASGLPRAFENGLVGRSLVLLGEYSYSIYLVHFPIIALYLYKPFSGTVLKPETGFDFALILGLIVVLGGALHHGVEIRKHAAGLKHAMAATVVVLGTTFLSPRVVASNFTPEELLIFAANEDRASFRCGEMFRVLEPGKKICVVGQKEQPKGENILLMGNSHADSIKMSLAQVANDLGHRMYITAENEPLRRDHPWVEGMIREVEDNKITTIFVHFAPYQNMTDVVGPFLERMQAANIRLIWLLPVPVYEEHVPMTLYRNVAAGQKLPQQTVETLREKYADIYAVAEKARNVAIFDPAEVLCQSDCLMKDETGRPLYYDNHHLTLTGAEKLADLFRQGLTTVPAPL